MKRYNIPDAVERYLAGESMKQIAESHGVSPIVIQRRVDEAGVKRSNSEAQRLRHGTNAVDEAEAARLYVEGITEQAISIKFGVSRGAIRSILVRQGVQLRTLKEAMQLRASRLSKEDRLRFSAAAHAAVRGVPHSEEHRIKTAISRQVSKSQVSPAETEFAEALEARGLSVVQQQAIGRYNVDVAITESSIAVEVFGGHWHASGSHGARHRKRTDYILDRGWLPIIVWVTTDFPLTPKAVDYVIACHEVFGSKEAERSEEHVIRGDGEGGPVSHSHPNRVPVISCYKASFDARRNNSRAG